MEERIQNLLTSLEAIKSNPALDTQEYQMKPEEKSKITVELKAIQADLLKAIDEFAVSFNIDLESSNITEQPQEEPPLPPPLTQLDQPPVPPPTQGDQPQPEVQLEPGTKEEMYSSDDDEDDYDDEDVQQNNDGLDGGNKKQTKKTKSKSKKTTQKNKKKN